MEIKPMRSGRVCNCLEQDSEDYKMPKITFVLDHRKKGTGIGRIRRMNRIPDALIRVIIDQIRIIFLLHNQVWDYILLLYQKG